MAREIQVFTIGGKYQTSYELDQLSDALTDIENNGFQVLNINFAPDGNLVLIIADTLNQIEQVYKMGKASIQEVCQLRTMYNLPCERCSYSDKCKVLKKKEGKENEKKQRKQRSKRTSSK